jgi:hypothetical protein
MKREKPMYEVEIKSQALLKDGKKSLITYFKGGPKKAIVKNVQMLYPQYTNPVDQPIVNISPISINEYHERLGGKQIVHKQHLVNTEGNILKVEDYETVGN